MHAYPLLTEQYFWVYHSNYGLTEFRAWRFIAQPHWLNTCCRGIDSLRENWRDDIIAKKERKKRERKNVANTREIYLYCLNTSSYPIRCLSYTWKNLIEKHCKHKVLNTHVKLTILPATDNFLVLLQKTLNWKFWSCDAISDFWPV